VAQGRSDHGPTFTGKIMEAKKENTDAIAREVRLVEAIRKIAQDDKEFLKRLSS
jgi:hypothetical protein